MRDKIEEFGSIFRFLTPLLIAIVGYTSIQYLSAINTKFGSIDAKFDNFLESYHVLDKRVDKLEYKVFDNIKE